MLSDKKNTDASKCRSVQKDKNAVKQRDTCKILIDIRAGINCMTTNY